MASVVPVPDITIRISWARDQEVKGLLDFSLTHFSLLPCLPTCALLRSCNSSFMLSTHSRSQCLCQFHFQLGRQLAENLHWILCDMRPWAIQRKAARACQFLGIFEDPLFGVVIQQSKSSIGSTDTHAHAHMHAQRCTAALGMLQGRLEFSLPLFFQVPSLGMGWPDTIHYRGQTTASTIIILP